MRYQKYNIAAWFLFTLTLPGRAELSWARTDISYQNDLTNTTVSGIFKFQNKGEQQIKIKSVKTSCQCAVAGLTKRVYAANETGELTVTLNTKRKTTPMQASVRVETDDGQVTVLTLRTVVPDFIKVSPGFVFWHHNEEPKAKSLLVEITKEGVKELIVSSSDPTFTVTVTAEQSGKLYRVGVTPKSTATATVTTLTIQTDIPKEQPARVFAYAKTL